MIDEFHESVHYVEIDIEEDPEIAEAAGIMGTPCVQFFKNKEMIRSVMHLIYIIFDTYMPLPKKHIHFKPYTSTLVGHVSVTYWSTIKKYSMAHTEQEQDRQKKVFLKICFCSKVWLRIQMYF